MTGSIRAVSSKLAWIAAGAVALALTLVGCGAASPTASSTASTDPSAAASASATASAAPTAHPSLAASTSIDAITVTGGFGTPPTVSIPFPYAINETKSKVLIAGKGAELTATTVVDVNYLGINGYTNATFDSSYSRGATAQFSLANVVPGFTKGLTGKHVGDRVLIAIPGKDGYDSQGGSSDAGILVGDTLIFVFDISDMMYEKPFGTAVTPPGGLPTVKDTNGVPDVTINTAAAPPTTTVVQPLIAGGGTHKIAATDAIYVHYRMYSWKTGKLLTDSYGDGDSGNLADTVPCWKTGLVDKPLGSRILLICPPSTGFPSGNPTPAVEAGDTVVFVVDLMFGVTQQA